MASVRSARPRPVASPPGQRPPCLLTARTSAWCVPVRRRGRHSHCVGRLGLIQWPSGPACVFSEFCWDHAREQNRWDTGRQRLSFRSKGPDSLPKSLCQAHATGSAPECPAPRRGARCCLSLLRCLWVRTPALPLLTRPMGGSGHCALAAQPHPESARRLRSRRLFCELRFVGTTGPATGRQVAVG